jgi:hypothetical protein
MVQLLADKALNAGIKSYFIRLTIIAFFFNVQEAFFAHKIHLADGLKENDMTAGNFITFIRSPR